MLGSSIYSYLQNIIMLNIYNYTAILLFIFSLLTFLKDTKNKRVRSLLLFSIIWLILYEGLRWQIGTDWDSYYTHFFIEDESNHSEIGYIVLMQIVHLFSNDYSVFLLLITSFFYLTLWSFLGKYSYAPLMSLTIYYCLMLGLLGSNRQLIALFICLISLKYCFEKNLRKFLCCIIVAILFHTTSIIFILAYIITSRKIGNKYIVYGVLVALLIGISGIINKIPYLDLLVYLDAKSSEKLSFYSNNDISNYSYLGTVKRLMILVPCLFLRLKIKNEKFDTFVKLYVMGCLIYFVFNGSMLQLMAGRGALYFSIFEMLVIPIVIRVLIRGQGQRLFIWFAYFCLLVYLMNRDMDFYLLGGEDIYRPYKSVLF